jgi:hypothetical protein
LTVNAAVEPWTLAGALDASRTSRQTERDWPGLKAIGAIVVGSGVASGVTVHDPAVVATSETMRYGETVLDAVVYEMLEAVTLMGVTPVFLRTMGVTATTERPGRRAVIERSVEYEERSLTVRPIVPLVIAVALVATDLFHMA